MISNTVATYSEQNDESKMRFKPESLLVTMVMTKASSDLSEIS